MVNRFRRIAALTLVGAFLVAAPAQAGSYDTEAGNLPPAFDAMVMRPIGFLMTIGGAALFTVAAPFVLITRPTEIDKPFTTLVIRPAEYTWVDPLGSH